MSELMLAAPTIHRMPNKMATIPITTPIMEGPLPGLILFIANSPFNYKCITSAVSFADSATAVQKLQQDQRLFF